MEWLLIFLVILITIFTYLLFAPFYLEVDSIQGLFRIRFHKLGAARLVIKDSSLKVDLIIAGWKKQIDPFSWGHQQAKPPSAIKRRIKKNIPLSAVKAMAKSFKLTKCFLTIDTGNMPLNGLMYPGFYWLSRLTGKTFEISFSGNNELILEIRNNIASIIKAFIFHSFINKKKHGHFK